MLQEFENNLEKTKGSKEIKQKKIRKFVQKARNTEEEGEQSSLIEGVLEKIERCITPKEKNPDLRLFRVSWKSKKTRRFSVLSSREIKEKYGNDKLFEFYEQNYY